jgi:hypothetical protein
VCVYVYIVHMCVCVCMYATIIIEGSLLMPLIKDIVTVRCMCVCVCIHCVHVYMYETFIIEDRCSCP